MKNIVYAIMHTVETLQLGWAYSLPASVDFYAYLLKVAPLSACEILLTICTVHVCFQIYYNFYLSDFQGTLN